MAGGNYKPAAGGSGPADTGSDDKAKRVQNQVDEVIGIMHNNIEKVMARGEKLESLQSKTDDLQQGALQFKRGRLKKKRLRIIFGRFKLCIDFFLCMLLFYRYFVLKNSLLNSY